MSRLLLLHALGTDSRCWDELPVKAITMDLPGHGSAPCLPRGAGIGDFAAVVAAHLAGERVHVAGLSLGGLVAQELAARWPRLVDRLVLADTVATYPEPMRAMWRSRAAIARSQGLAELADPMAAMWFTDPPGPTATRIRDLFLTTNPEGYARACEALEHADTTPVAPTIQAPTLIICGTADLPPFTDAACWLHAHIPGAALTWFINAKHAAVLEQPAEFAAHLTEFLD